MNAQKDIDKAVEEELKVFGLTPDNLTKEELKELRSQVESEMNGNVIMFDGVLSDQEIITRGYKNPKNLHLNHYGKQDN